MVGGSSPEGCGHGLSGPMWKLQTYILICVYAHMYLDCQCSRVFKILSKVHAFILICSGSDLNDMNSTISAHYIFVGTLHLCRCTTQKKTIIVGALKLWKPIVVLVSAQNTCRRNQQWLLTYNKALSGSVLLKTAIFPKKQGRKREISNESARGWSLQEANV